MQFLQSSTDFPLNVSLGKKSPDFGLHRFKQGLRFVPLDDEGFTLRGDRRRLLYKGRRRSHRFTILGDCAFEYDCILLQEPESNVISILMEGAENFDFLRQPDFVSDDFLKGSYAVYKKETLIGEGTGKLCHIHRPEIIDARGRRCWGDLAVVGNELRIIIPEWFLSGAKYPVVVDPTIGTTTAGSVYKYRPEPGDPLQPLVFEVQIPVNKFLVPETINGVCTAFFNTYNKEVDLGGYPVIYSDNQDKPQQRKSSLESFIDLGFEDNKPAGWRSGTFIINESIPSGSYIWFGLFTNYFWSPRFDWGYKCYCDFYNGGQIPNTYPLFQANNYYDFKLPMYFTFSTAQNYVRTLTQGVTLTDKRKLTGNYKRSLAQKAGVNSALSRFETVYRKCVMSVGSSMNIRRLTSLFLNVKESVKAITSNYENRSVSRKCADGVKVNSETIKKFNYSRAVAQGVKLSDNRKMAGGYKRIAAQTAGINSAFTRFETFFRMCAMTANSLMSMSRLPVFFRNVAESVKIITANSESRSISRKCADGVEVNSGVARFNSVMRKVQDTLKGTDILPFSVLFVRTVTDNTIITQHNRHLGAFFRGLRFFAGNTAETRHRAEYYRYHADTVQAAGAVFRGLLLFVRIVTKVFIRDYLLSRFLIAREELVLKSCVVREVVLESKIN